MLLELAIGDAYGAGFEYAPAAFVKQNNKLTQYFPHQRYSTIYRRYTDDTQMTLAIAELMLENEDWSSRNIASKFVEVFKRDPREGYSSRLFKILTRTNDADEFLKQINPNSDRSGAAMRVSPIGLFPDEKEVIEKSIMQAKVTHNTTDGIEAAKAAALIVHYFYYRKGMKKELGQFLNSKLNGNWDENWETSVGNKGWMAVKAAVTALKRSSSMRELLLNCIGCTGDVDTVAAIALAAGSLCTEIKQDIPEWMYSDLENGAFGKNYLDELDKALLKKYTASI